MDDRKEPVPHPLAGRKHAIEHIEKRKVAVAAAKAAWSPERREAFRQRCREANAERKRKRAGSSNAAKSVAERRAAPAPVTIYALVDPRSGELRYVGKTSLTVERRLSAHASNVRRGLHSHKHHWLRDVMRAGLEPSTAVLEVVPPGDDWIEAEKFWIGYFRFLGARLVNQCDGGQGTSGISFSAEHRERLRVSHLGKKRSPEHNAKMAEIHRRAWARGRARGWTEASYEKMRKTRAERAAAGLYRRRTRSLDSAGDPAAHDPPR
jgi:hypothetical protein